MKIINILETDDADESDDAQPTDPYIAALNQYVGSLATTEEKIAYLRRLKPAMLAKHTTVERRFDKYYDDQWYKVKNDIFKNPKCATWTEVAVPDEITGRPDTIYINPDLPPESITTLIKTAKKYSRTWAIYWHVGSLLKALRAQQRTTK